MAASSNAPSVGASNNNEEKRVSPSPAPVPLNREFLGPESAKLTRISITGGETKTISGVPKEVKEIVDRVLGDKENKELEQNAQDTYPIAHHNIRPLINMFLAYKKEHGSSVEKKLYSDMTSEVFIQRLLTKRPCRFVNSSDDATLWFGGEIPPKNGFDKIGTTEEKSPLCLENYISYDEMQISALLGLSSPTRFINDGDLYNDGRPQQDEKKYESSGIYVGLVGPRFERPGLMDWQHIVITSEQNTTENGYGANAKLSATDTSSDAAKAKAAKIAKNRMWAKFYGVRSGNFPLFSEVKPNSSFISAGENRYINLPVYKARMRMVIEPYLIEANKRAREAGKIAYVHSAGLGLGVFLGPFQNQPIQDLLVGAAIDVFEEVILDTHLPHIKDIDLGHFPLSHDQPGEFREKKLGEIKDVLGHGINLQCSKRNPAAKLPGSGERLLVANFAWDANAFVGNEFWIGSLDASGDPAAACCSEICVTQNPVANPGAMMRLTQFFMRPFIVEVPLQGNDFFEILWSAKNLALKFSSSSLYRLFMNLPSDPSEDKTVMPLSKNSKEISEFFKRMLGTEGAQSSERRLLMFLLKETMQPSVKEKVLAELKSEVDTNSGSENVIRANAYLEDKTLLIRFGANEDKLKGHVSLGFRSYDSKPNRIQPDVMLILDPPVPNRIQPIVMLILDPSVDSRVLSVFRLLAPNVLQESLANPVSEHMTIPFDGIKLFIENIKHISTDIIAENDRNNLIAGLSKFLEMSAANEICPAFPMILEAKWDEKGKKVTLVFSSMELAARSCLNIFSDNASVAPVFKEHIEKRINNANQPFGFAVEYPINEKMDLLHLLGKLESFADDCPIDFGNNNCLAIANQIRNNRPIQLNKGAEPADASTSSSQGAPKIQAEVKGQEAKGNTPPTSSGPTIEWNEEDKEWDITFESHSVYAEFAFKHRLLTEADRQHKKFSNWDAHGFNERRLKDIFRKLLRGDDRDRAIAMKIEEANCIPPEVKESLRQIKAGAARAKRSSSSMMNDALGATNRIGTERKITETEQKPQPTVEWRSEDGGRLYIIFDSTDAYEDFTKRNKIWNESDPNRKTYDQHYFSNTEAITSIYKKLLQSDDDCDKAIAEKIIETKNMPDDMKEMLAKIQAQVAQSRSAQQEAKALRVNTSDENDSTPSSSPVNSPVGTPSPSVLSPARGAHVSLSRDGFTQQQNFVEIKKVLNDQWDFSKEQKDSRNMPFYHVTEKKGDGGFYIQPKTIVSSDNNVETFQAMLKACKAVHGEERPPTIYSDNPGWRSAFDEVYPNANLNICLITRNSYSDPAPIPVAAIPQPMPSAPPLTSSSSHLTRTAPPVPLSSPSLPSRRRSTPS